MAYSKSEANQIKSIQTCAKVIIGAIILYQGTQIFKGSSEYQQQTNAFNQYIDHYNISSKLTYAFGVFQMTSGVLLLCNHAFGPLLTCIVFIAHAATIDNPFHAVKKDFLTSDKMTLFLKDLVLILTMALFSLRKPVVVIHRAQLRNLKPRQ